MASPLLPSLFSSARLISSAEPTPSPAGYPVRGRSLPRLQAVGPDEWQVSRSIPMPTRKLKNGLAVMSGPNEPARFWAQPVEFGSESRLRKKMPAKSSSHGNTYVCAMERNQNGKYNIRIRATFGKGGWSLGAYFLASSFNAAMKKLEESLQMLQKSEERLRFWGVERTDDPNLAGDILQESGLWLDRRREFPRKVAELSIATERPVPASMLAPIRRVLADSVSQERVAQALAGD